jgi:hypothetical protein
MRRLKQAQGEKKKLELRRDWTFFWCGRSFVRAAQLVRINRLTWIFNHRGLKLFTEKFLMILSMSEPLKVRIYKCQSGIIFTQFLISIQELLLTLLASI